jgi:Flp pilus assembly protein TadG
MRSNRNQRGVAIIEFALVMPLLLVMTFMVTEFGRAIYQYNVVTKSVRDAARYLTIQTPNTKVAEAANLVVYGTTTTGTTPLIPGLTTAMVSANWPPATGTNPPISTVTVQVSGYTFDSMVLGAFGLPFGNITFSDIRATMRSHTS